MRMINPEEIYQRAIELLDKNDVEYKLFTHTPVLTYEESERVQKEQGYIGTEGKNMVLNVDGRFMVYVTIQGKRLNIDAIKEHVGAKKVKLATGDELKEHFGAQPGCAYPFGFGAEYTIYIDPVIYKQDWLIFSPVLPTKTVQAKGADLKKIFDSLENKVEEVTNFNQE